MDRSSLLPLLVATGATLVAVACVSFAFVLELYGHPTPPFLAGLAGTALGILTTCLTPLMAPKKAPVKKE